jgi:VanZ family protein
MPKHTKSTSINSKSFIRAYAAALFWAAVILVLISLPGEDLPDFDIWAIDIEDKMGHLGVFGLLAVLLIHGRYRRNGPLNRKELLIIFLIATGYGAFTEILQGLAFPTRFASIPDFIADALGALLGTIFGNLLIKYRRKS